VGVYYFEGNVGKDIRNERVLLTGWKSSIGWGPDCPGGTPMPGSTLYKVWGGMPGTGGEANRYTNNIHMSPMLA